MKKARKALYWFLDYRSKLSRGNQWIAIVEEYVPIQKAIDIFTTYIAVKLAVDHKSLTWILAAIVLFVGYKIFWEMLRLGIGVLYLKSGMLKAEVDWGSKNTKYNTYQVEMMKTLKSIAGATGAEDYFKELEHE